jgi:uncharacterized Zn finger protein (UPF0148 family)
MSKEKIIQEIGVRLLRGELMCAECCPFGCNCPLMKGKEGIVCVGCQRKFVRDVDGSMIEDAKHVPQTVEPQQNAILAKAPESLTKQTAKPSQNEETRVNAVATKMLEGFYTWIFVFTRLKHLARLDNAERFLSALLQSVGEVSS